MEVYSLLTLVIFVPIYTRAGLAIPQCPSTEECTLFCQGGYAVDDQGCTRCRCWQPCDDTTCFENQRCRSQKICTNWRVCNDYIIQGQCFDAEEACNSPKFDGFECGGQHKRVFYNSTSGRCELFIFTGCGPNANNFLELEDCQLSCESKPPVTRCFEPRKSGWTCDESKPRIATQQPIFNGLFSFSLISDINKWYFDRDTRQCLHLGYLGCGSNGNNFESLADCQNECMTGRREPPVRVREPPARVREPPARIREPPVPRNRARRRDPSDSTCDSNETYNPCWNVECGLEPTCSDQNPENDPDRACPDVCQPKCLCKQGFFRDTRGQCVSLDKC